MNIRGKQEVVIEVHDKDMKDIVHCWLCKVFGFGEHDYIDCDMNPVELVRQEDRSTHKTEYGVVERRPATDLEIHVWYVLQGIRKL